MELQLGRMAGADLRDGRSSSTLQALYFVYAPFALLKIGLYKTYFWRAWAAVQKILGLLISDYVWLTPSLKPSPYYKFVGQQLHAWKILTFTTLEKTWKIHGVRAQVLNIMSPKMGNDMGNS